MKAHHIFWEKTSKHSYNDKRYLPIIVFRFSTTGSATQCLRSLWRWALTTPTLPSVDTAKGASAESDSSTASDSDSPAQKSTIQGVTQQPHVMIWDNAPRFSFSNQHEIKKDPIYVLHGLIISNVPIFQTVFVIFYQSELAFVVMTSSLPGSISTVIRATSSSSERGLGLADSLVRALHLLGLKG